MCNEHFVFKETNLRRSDFSSCLPVSFMSLQNLFGHFPGTEVVDVKYLNSLCRADQQTPFPMYRDHGHGLVPECNGREERRGANI